MMTKGWWVYAAVLLTITAIGALGSGGTTADAVFAVVINFLFLVLVPRLIQLGWRRMRHREA